jgi:hypothetical protein
LGTKVKKRIKPIVYKITYVTLVICSNKPLIDLKLGRRVMHKKKMIKTKDVTIIILVATP